MESDVATREQSDERVGSAFRNMFPENLLQACFQQVETIYENVTKPGLDKDSPPQYIQRRKLVFKNGTNVLGLIVFCIAFGVVSGQMGSQADLMVKFFVQVGRQAFRS